LLVVAANALALTPYFYLTIVALLSMARKPGISTIGKMHQQEMGNVELNHHFI